MEIAHVLRKDMNVRKKEFLNEGNKESERMCQHVRQKKNNKNIFWGNYASGFPASTENFSVIIREN